MIQKRSTGDVATYQSCPYHYIAILPLHWLSVYSHHLIIITIILQIRLHTANRQKTRVVLHINHISHHRHRPLSLYRPPHRSSPSSATTYNQQRLSSTTCKYSTNICHIPIQRLQRHVITIFNIHRPSYIHLDCRPLPDIVCSVTPV